MNYKDLSRPLTSKEVEFRIQSINGGKFANILVYKNSRVDMQRLDEVVGCNNWKREHLRNNSNCVVSIWDESKKQWVGKEDTGTESNTEAEKGLASDSFKRACFNWGIGRELYSYPKISIRLNDKEVTETTYNGKKKYKQSYDLDLNSWKWEIEFNEKNELLLLRCFDNNNKQRFIYKKK